MFFTLCCQTIDPNCAMNLNHELMMIVSLHQNSAAD